MTTVAALSTPGRRSFLAICLATCLATWRLLARGHERVVATAIIGGVVGGFIVCWPMPRFYFEQTLVMLLVWFGPMTWYLEPAVADRVAFMNLVPQPVPNRWLLLAPMCALGLLDSAAMVVAGRGPGIAVIAGFGCACWIIGATRWLRRIRYWPVAAPLVLAVPVVAAVVLRAAGWGAATAVSALGFAAIAFQPGAWLAAGSPGHAARRGADLAARVAFDQRAISIPRRGPAGWLVAAAWYMRLSSRPYMHFDFGLIPFAVLLTLLFNFPGNAALLIAFCVPAHAIVVAFSPEAHEFVGPRPFSERQRWVGGLAYPMLVTFVLTASMLPCLSLEWFNGGGLTGHLLKQPFLREASMSYLRDVLGAVFLPEKWPAGGLSHDQWSRVRPLLWLDLLRASLLAVAALFVRAAYPLARGGGTLTRWFPPVNSVLLVLIFACALRFAPLSTIFRWVPPWWVAAVLAPAAIAHWLSHVGVAKPTGSSRAG